MQFLLFNSLKDLNFTKSLNYKNMNLVDLNLKLNKQENILL